MLLLKSVSERGYSILSATLAMASTNSAKFIFIYFSLVNSSTYVCMLMLNSGPMSLTPNESEVTPDAWTRVMNCFNSRLRSYPGRYLVQLLKMSLITLRLSWITFSTASYQYFSRRHVWQLILLKVGAKHLSNIYLTRSWGFWFLYFSIANLNNTSMN